MTKILSFSVDEETYAALAQLEDKLNFRNRSDAIRAAVRSLTEEIENIENLKGIITSVAVVVHEPGAKEVEELKHEFDDVIATQVHNSFSRKCVEVFVLNGNADRIAHFGKQLKTMPKLTYARLVNPHPVHRHR